MWIHGLVIARRIGSAHGSRYSGIFPAARFVWTRRIDNVEAYTQNDASLSVGPTVVNESVRDPARARIGRVVRWSPFDLRAPRASRAKHRHMDMSAEKG